MRNRYALLLFIVGVMVIVVGVIGSVILGSTIPAASYKALGVTIEVYNWKIAVAGSAASILVGVLFLGFAEHIDLTDYICQALDDIINKDSE